MPLPPEASPLADLELALSASRSDRASDAALRAFRGKVSPMDIVRSAARTVALRYDPASGLAPHALAALGASIELARLLEPAQGPIPVLQAVALAASEKKLTAPQGAPSVVAGEVSHLGRSALLAARAGEGLAAEPLFLGILDEGRERRMAGEILFRASLEDPGDSGHKLLTAVALWRLARVLGFREARILLRPAAQYLLVAEPVRHPHESMLAYLAREWVDPELLASGGRPLDDGGQERLATALATPSEDTCLAAVLDLLRSGYAAGCLAEGIGLEASRRLVAAEGYHPELIHALLFAESCRFVVNFSRSSERVYAVFQAALRVRSPAPHLPSVAIPDPPSEADGLQRLADDLNARRPREAAARVRVCLARRHAAKPLVALLAYHASLDSALANAGHNLLLADACAAAYAETHGPEFLMALAKTVAASPKDLAASKAWSAALGP